MQSGQKQKGFTIVELLIVVIVIAILATITIVGFNAVQNRARESAAQAGASQAARKITAYAALNSDRFPTSLSEADLPNTDNSLQYTGGGGTFCVTSTIQNISYFQRNGGQITKGSCNGHDRDGVAAITNLLSNPSFETGSTGGGSNISNSSGQMTTPGGGSIAGDRFLRMTLANNNNAGMGRGQLSESLPNGRYTASFWVRSNRAITFQNYYEGSAARTTVEQSAIAVTLSPNAWTRLWRTFDITAPGNVKVGGYCTSACTAGMTVGQDYIDLDGFMLTSGDTVYGYADGSSPGWDWNGEPNDSTSRGPALP